MKSFVRVMKAIVILALVCSLSACPGKETKETPPVAEKSGGTFSSEVLKVPDAGVNKVRGQVLYIPIYSNIPYLDKKMFDLSAFLAIHNTDLKNPIQITKVLYFDNDGKLVKEFIAAEKKLAPLGATNFYIPQSDQSGTGANFIVEWVSDVPVTEPLIESIMLNLEGNRGVSLLSRGEVIREVR